MSQTQGPQIGQVSPDGQFRWDGQEWMPLARGYREPTSWTVPMQRAAAAYLVLATIEQLVTTALFTNTVNVERVMRASNPAMPSDQVQAAASIGVISGWAVVIAAGALMVFLAVATVLRWRWAFWVVLVWLALNSILVVTSAFALMSTSIQVQPRGSIAAGLIFAVAALALLVWFIVAAARHGPWAMRRPGP